MEELIQIQGLRKTYHGVPVLRGLDLQVNARQLTVLIGPSGCGKSTLLRCINGLEIFDEGMIRLNGIVLQRDMDHPLSHREFHRLTHQLRSMVGMVFQSFNLFPHMTALENVAKPPCIVQGISPDEARDRALTLLDKVGLRDKSGHYPSQLSGGQQQRAAIARALAMKPKVILYDEPTSALDPGLADEVLQVMKELDQEGITQIVVTHEMRFAREAADKIVFIDAGIVVEEGEEDRLFSNPSDPRTKQFLKHYL
jgi:polar amino acid transport system ATP-binding protein